MTLKRLGVYGGTFDPPHLGHLILAETAADSLNLDRVLFAPAAHPPHKDSADIRASITHRLVMVERAIAENARFALSRVDVDRPGPHYTADMLLLLCAAYPGVELVFLIGGDSLRDLPTWSRPAEIVRLARLGVMRRPGGAVDSDIDLDAIAAKIPGLDDLAARVRWVDAPLITLSATVIAARIAAGQSVRYQIPDAVLDYIGEHGLYQ